MDGHPQISLWLLVATPLALWSLYEIWICLAGIPQLPEAPRASAIRRLAVLIAAHNEEAVIAKTIVSLQNQKYPRHAFEVFMVADRCTDRTAARAAEAGATVVERDAPEGGGKSAALRFLFDWVAAERGCFDSVCIFDADNLVSPNFLDVMNRHRELGERCIQAVLDVKNPGDSWVTGAIAIAYWSTNRLWQAARYRLGLNCALGGTGFCLEWSLAEELGWKSQCLTEDLELQASLVLAGDRVSWAPETRTYDEKPITLGASCKQRVRWMRGHWDVARRRTGRLLVRAITHLDFVALDTALYLLQPLRCVAAALALGWVVVAAALGQVPEPFFLVFGAVAITYLAYLSHFCFAGLPAVGLWLERVPFRYWRYYPAALAFGFTWIPVAFWGMATSRRTHWDKTVHTRALEAPDSSFAPSVVPLRSSPPRPS